MPAKEQTRVASNLAKALLEKPRRRRRAPLVEKYEALARALQRFKEDGHILALLRAAVSINLGA